MAFTAGFARGYRAWAVRADFMSTAPKLMPITYYSRPWSPGKNNAVCGTLEEIERHISAVQFSTITTGCICNICQQPTAEYVQQMRAHRVPSRTLPCVHCGFYAAHTPDMLAEVSSHYIKPDAGVIVIYGCIKATGNVIIAEKGFRARYAEIEALVMPHDFIPQCGRAKIGQLAYLLNGEYRVPIYNTFAKLVKDFPVIPLEGVCYTTASDMEEKNMAYIKAMQANGMCTSTAWWQLGGYGPAGSATWSV